MARNRSTLIDLGGETVISPQPLDAPGPGATNKVLPIRNKLIVGAMLQAGRVVVTTVGAGDGFPVYADRQATINPGDNINSVINSFAPGTLYGFAQGTHNITSAGTQWTPRQGDRFVGVTTSAGVPLSIIRGNWNGTQGGGGLESPFPFANTGAYPSGVQLLRLDIQMFASQSQQCALNGGDGWRIHKCYIHDMLSGGVRIGTNATMSGGKVYRCGQIGLKQKTGCDNGVFDGVEVYDNNFADWNTLGFEAGGMKFAGGLPTNMIIRNCHFHDNHGPGIWYDAAGAGGRIENNISEDNLRAGIFYELTNGAGMIIQNNTVRRNAGAGDIYVANSRGVAGNPVIVRNNIVGPHPHGVGTISLKDDGSRNVRLGYTRVENNQITDEISLSNVFGDNGADGTTAPGIEFISNDYFSDAFGSGSGLGWNYGTKKTWAQWQALGFDVAGTRQPAP